MNIGSESHPLAWTDSGSCLKFLLGMLRVASQLGPNAHLSLG